MPTRPATEPKPDPVDHAAVQQAQRDAGDTLEAQRLDRIAARDNPGHHPSLASALVAFQAEMPRVPKGKTAKIETKGGGSYGYKYADLADVSAIATPLLTKHGIAFLTLPGFTESGAPVLRGQLLHALGDSIEAEGLPMYGRTAQEIGSSLTYNRRYLFGCLTGIVTDEDEDGTLAAAAQAAVSAPPPLSPEQQELTDELNALDEPVAARIRAEWPFPGRGPGNLTPGEIQMVRARVDVAIAEAAASTEPPS